MSWSWAYSGFGSLVRDRLSSATPGDKAACIFSFEGIAVPPGMGSDGDAGEVSDPPSNRALTLIEAVLGPTPGGPLELAASRDDLLSECTGDDL